jgi:hypothetical protein
VEGASGTIGYLDDATDFSYGFLLYVGSESDDKEGAGPKSKDKYHARNGTYTDLGRKETPNVGRPYKGPRL